MIRIVSSIEVQSLDMEGEPVYTLPMVPASGKVEVSDTAESAGLLRTVTIEAVLKETVAALTGRVIVKVTYCDGSVETFGSAALPVRFGVKIGQNIQISAKYQTTFLLP